MQFTHPPWTKPGVLGVDDRPEWTLTSGRRALMGSDRMMILVTVLICGIRQYGTLGVSLNGLGTSEWTDNTGLSLPARVRGSSVVTKREFEGLLIPDDQDMCYLLKEKEDERHIICQHRLTRSKFNFNPFGLRFGKRNSVYRSQIGLTKSRPNKMSILFKIRELDVPT